MRLRLAAAAATAMLVALAPVGAAGDAGSARTSAAKSCAKHRKHHRKHRRHRHRKHRCDSAQSGGAGAGAGGGQGGSAKCNGSDSPGRIGFDEREYSIAPTMPSGACGTPIVEQRNKGMDGHDLVLQKDGDPAPSYSFSELGAGGVAKQTLDLSRGTWTFYCDIAEPAPGHRALGMEVKLVVQ